MANFERIAMCKLTLDMPNICGFDPRVELTNALEHLRQATADATRAIPCLVGTQAGQRAAILAVDVEAAARACAGLVDNLDGSDEAADR
jgi:hypothetical protein